MGPTAGNPEASAITASVTVIRLTFIIERSSFKFCKSSIAMVSLGCCSRVKYATHPARIIISRAASETTNVCGSLHTDHPPILSEFWTLLALTQVTQQCTELAMEQQIVKFG